MKFGFDIDDTLIDLRAHAFAIYNKKMGKNIPIDIFHTLKRVEIHEPFGLSDAEGAAMWSSSLEEIYFTNCLWDARCREGSDYKRACFRCLCR